jgi:hypothetical protein
MQLVDEQHEAFVLVVDGDDDGDIEGGLQGVHETVRIVLLDRRRSSR